MEENYSVFFGTDSVGQVRVTRQGLYYRFLCRCRLAGEILCRLQVTCGDRQEDLGIVVPVEGGFGLDTKLPVKRLGLGAMAFRLLPKHEIPKEKFAPIYPEEPFSYISKLKQSYLVKRNGQLGILLD